MHMRGATPCSLSNVDPKCICDLFGCSDDSAKALLEVCEALDVERGTGRAQALPQDSL